MFCISTNVSTSNGSMQCLPGHGQVVRDFDHHYEIAQEMKRVIFQRKIVSQNLMDHFLIMQDIFSNILKMKYLVHRYRPTLACARLTLIRRQDDCSDVFLSVLAHKHDLQFRDVIVNKQQTLALSFSDSCRKCNIQLLINAFKRLKWAISLFYRLNTNYLVSAFFCSKRNHVRMWHTFIWSCTE